MFPFWWSHGCVYQKQSSFGLVLLVLVVSYLIVQKYGASRNRKGQAGERLSHTDLMPQLRWAWECGKCCTQTK